MAEEQDDGEKTEEPSQHRIEEFRKKGDVASSRELTSVLVLAACLLALSLSLVYIYEELTKYVEWLYTLDASTAFTEKSLHTITTRTFAVAIKCGAPVMFTALCVGVLVQIAQIGFLYSPDILELNFDRVNPINGIKKLFSMQSLFETVKGIIKFAVILAVVYAYLKDDIARYNGFMHLEIYQSFLYGKELLMKISFAILMALGVVAMMDFAYQKFTYQKKIRQTKQQLKQESKEQDGNPEIKQRIRQIQREMSRKRMIKDVQTADVIVTNPTHISIVLKYDAQNMVSPMVIGKGQDHMALKIRELAKLHNIPIVENVLLARTLYKTVKVGAPVPRNLYKAVAEVLSFVYKLKKKKKALA
ncbi:MAG: flagellar biosynthesis protein FlhB [Bacteriovorax sp.]|jgi:flagellar biosynthetic protein FlhB|nr:flagellar biosynthesis protein FlhB [Bacteriovorax sp.]